MMNTNQREIHHASKLYHLVPARMQAKKEGSKQASKLESLHSCFKPATARHTNDDVPGRLVRDSNPPARQAKVLLPGGYRRTDEVRLAASRVNAAVRFRLRPQR